MKNLLFFIYMLSLFFTTQTIVAEKTPTQEPSALDDNFFANLFKKKEPKKEACPPEPKLSSRAMAQEGLPAGALSLSKTRAQEGKQKELKPPSIKEIHQLGKEISNLGKDINDVTKKLTNFPTTEPMKKQIDDLKKEEEKKSQDAEKRRKDMLKSSGSSRYRAPSSGSDYGSSRRRDSGRRRGDSDSGWSPWGGSDSSSGGRGRSSWGDSSNQSSPFSKDTDKSTGIKQDTDTSTPSPTTASGGTIAGRETEETKDAKKRYTKAIQKYKEAIASIEKYTQLDDKKKQDKREETLIEDASDCEKIKKSIEIAENARRGIPEKICTEQQKEELKKQEAAVKTEIRNMFPTALAAATKISADLKPINAENQKKIKNFIEKTVKEPAGPIGDSEYKSKVNDRVTELLAKLKNTEYTKNISAAEKHGNIGKDTVTKNAITPDEALTRKALDDIKPYEEQFRLISTLLPKIENNRIDEERNRLKESIENLDTKIALIDLNTRYDKAKEKKAELLKGSSTAPSKEDVQNEYNTLIKDFENLAKKEALKKYKKELEKRIKDITTEKP